MQASPVKGEPRDSARTSDVRPEVHRVPAPQPRRQHQRQGQEDRERDEAQLTGRIKDRQDQQPECIIGNGEQEQERDARMPRTEDDPCDEVAERDVGGERDGPSPHEFRPIEREHQGGVYRGGARHAADRRDQRHRGAARRMQRTTRGRRLHDLLRRQSEEEDHPDIVHGEVEGVRDGLVAVSIDVRPDKREYRAEDEQARVVEQGGEPVSHPPSCRPSKT